MTQQEEDRFDELLDEQVSGPLTMHERKECDRLADKWEAAHLKPNRAHAVIS